jgi:hypothetical protein
MEIDPLSIKENLKKKEKLYLKILLKTLKEEKNISRKNDLAKSLSIIAHEFSNDKLSYTDLEQIMPISAIDKERFTELFSK